jgi:hypothetical protein
LNQYPASLVIMSKRLGIVSVWGRGGVVRVALMVNLNNLLQPADQWVMPEMCLLFNQPLSIILHTF